MDINEVVNAQTRDYDKEPIVIEDYNSLFVALFALGLVPFMIYGYIYNPGGTSEGSLFRNMVIIIPLMMYPYYMGYLKSKGKRKIVLLNNTIRFLHEESVLEEIDIKDITNVQRTYSDLYHKSQYEGPFGKMLSYIFSPLGLLRHLILVISKWLFHLYKDGFCSYRFYDALIVFSGEKFINVLPSTLREYGEVSEYFKVKKGTSVEDCEIFFEYSHLHEKIEIGEKEEKGS